MELPLGDVAVVALELLLGAELGAVVGQFLGAALAVLAGSVGALVHRALGTAPEVLSRPAIKLVFGSRAFRHRLSKLAEKLGFREVRLAEGRAI